MRVLVTRPEPGASKTAERLKALGHEPVVLPLTVVSPIAEAELADSSAFDAVAVTSANALIHAPKALLPQLAGLPCLAVGDRTADAAREAGFATVMSADGDAADLVALVTEKLPAGAKLAYLCGQRRRAALEEGLVARGFAVSAIETYRTDPIDYSPSEIARTVGACAIDAVLVYSRFGAERLEHLISAPGAEAWCADMRILCMSEQVAEGLSARHRRCVEIAGQPAEKALIALLGRAL